MSGILFGVVSVLVVASILWLTWDAVDVVRRERARRLARRDLERTRETTDWLWEHRWDR